jgi:hypothetical protein
MTKQLLKIDIKASLLGGFFSGLVNTTTAWFGFRQLDAVPLTVDLISTGDKTVWGQGVSLAFTLGVVLTLLGSRSFARKISATAPALSARVNRPLWPYVAGVALTNALFLFGCFMVLAVMWQRLLGTITVGRGTAAVLVGLLAWVIATLTDLRTKRAMLRDG